MPADIPKITDWMQASAAVVTAVIALILLLQLRFAKKQLEATGKQIELTREQMEIGQRWNRLNATFTYFAHDLYNQLERDAADKVRPLGIDLYTATEPLPSDIVIKINENPDIYFPVKAFLNLLEDYSTAVRTGAFDPQCAYSIMAGIIIRYAKVFAPFIKTMRGSEYDDYYIEVETLANNWTAGYQTEIEKQREKGCGNTLKHTKRDIGDTKGA